MAALDPADFTRRWVFPPDTEQGKKLKLEAIYGTPVATKDSVYFGGYDGNVYALSSLDGSLRWSFPTGGPIIGGVALLDPDPKEHPERARLFVGSDDGKLYALDPEDGSQKHEPFDAGDSIWATPLVAGSVVYVPSVNGKLYALDEQTLQPVWDKPFEAGAGLVTDPVLADENTILVGGIDKSLYALDTGNGKVKWSFAANNWFWGRPLVADGKAYAPNLDGGVYALDASTGKPVWDQPFKGAEAVRSSPLLAANVLVVADKAGNVYGLDPATGVPKWSGPAVLAKTVLADSILLQDQVLVLAQGGNLFRIDPRAGVSSLVQVKTP